MARKLSVPIAFRVQKYLRGLTYPADKTKLIQHARHRGIEHEGALMEALLSLPDKEYPSPISLAQALGAASAAKT